MNKALWVDIVLVIVIAAFVFWLFHREAKRVNPDYRLFRKGPRRT